MRDAQRSVDGKLLERGFSGCERVHIVRVSSRSDLADDIDYFGHTVFFLSFMVTMRLRRCSPAVPLSSNRSWLLNRVLFWSARCVGHRGQAITFAYSRNLVTFFRPFLISPLSQQIEKDLSVGRERALFVVDDIAVAFHVKIRDTELLERAARESFFHCVFVQESHSQFLVDSALDRFRR